MMRALAIIAIISSLLVLPAYSTPEIKLFNYSTYIDSSGAPVVVGEVINDGKESVKSVEVKASFIDPSGKILDSGSALTLIDLIPPGHRAPFMIVGATEYSFSVNSYELQVVNFAFGQSKPAKLEIISASDFTDGINEVRISGEIKNTGDKTTSMSKVYATFYDDSNRVLGFASVNTEPESIAPNAKASFKLNVHERIPSITSYTLYADSEQFSTAPFGLQSVVNPADIGNKVSVSRLALVDQQGQGIGKFAPNERAWIKSVLKSESSMEQDFTYIVQIKDKDGFSVELKWINGVLEPHMSLTQSISWTPDDEGIYFAEIFVWHGMENPIPLSTSIKTIILFVKA
ncbi:MAG: FxLYD domain-containing protein [Nitrososphaerales archaeon]